MIYALGKNEKKCSVSGLPFSFNQEVTEVFEDMIDRSVPGYNTTLRIIHQQDKNYCVDGTNVYDLGCSLGASTSSLLNALNGRSKVIAIDNSDSMIRSCRERFSRSIQAEQVKFLKEDRIELIRIVYRPYKVCDIPQNFGCITFQDDKEGISEWFNYKGYTYIIEE